MSDPGDALARFDGLLSPRGAELLARLAGEDVSPGTELRLATLLRAEYPAWLVSEALAQHDLRVRARPKFRRAMSMFFTRPGLEQASSELVSGHRARRYTGADAVADLCCGIGGDLVTLAAGHRVLAVDRDPLHLAMARANAAVHEAAGNVTAVCADVRDTGLAGVQAVFIDPARRAGPRRLRAGDSEPPLAWCLSLAARVGRVGIKAAPGLPREAVPDGWELEFIAVGRELKEAVLWSPPLATAARRAVILPGGHTLARPRAAGPASGPDGSPSGDLAGSPSGDPGGAAAVPVRPPGEYLYDPNPAVTRAGLVQDLARMTGAWQIDSQIAFLSADAAVPTPFARLLRIVDSGPWDQKRLPGRLRALGVGAVDIRRRGLAGDTGLLHRQLKLSGSRRATLVMTRVNDRPWALVCEDVGPAGP